MPGLRPFPFNKRYAVRFVGFEDFGHRMTLNDFWCDGQGHIMAQCWDQVWFPWHRVHSFVLLADEYQIDDQET